MVPAPGSARGSPSQPWRPDTLSPAQGMGLGWGSPAVWFMPLSLGKAPKQDDCALLGEDTHFPFHFYFIPYTCPLSSSWWGCLKSTDAALTKKGLVSCLLIL